MTRYPTEEELELWYKVNKHDFPAIVMPSKPYVHPILDLHNFTVQTAYEAVCDHILNAKQQGLTDLLHITGRSGIINKEYAQWIAKNKNVKTLKPLNGGGAWKIKLAK